ncbi:MAG TPA: universal stress protein [Nitrososphaeraceae archaeon]|jgi:nucleotide-binding universal stress UspA family protein|nr:universal stress protein [Nitrososphaeraceae archaeon]
MSNTQTKVSKILVAIDGSEMSMRAAAYAIDIANIKGKEEENVQLIGLTVIDLTNLSYSFFATASGYYEAEKLEEKRKEAQQLLDKVEKLAVKENNTNNNVNIQFKSEIIEDPISRIGSSIVDYAERENIDLIVIGTRGRTGFKKMLLGSVASDVVTYAHCPVLVVK